MRIRSFMLAAALVAPMSLQADVRQKAGLWENTIKVNLGGGMPAIPPEAMAQMEQMGLELPFAKPITNRVCLTPEQAAQYTLPDVTDPDSGCSVLNSKRSGDTLSADMRCDGTLKGEGRMEMTLASAESYTGAMQFSGMADGGMPMDMTSDFSGKWLSADCGDVAPMQ